MSEQDEASHGEQRDGSHRLSRRQWFGVAGAGTLALMAACRGAPEPGVEGRALSDELRVRWCWVGGVTSRWATVVAAIDGGAEVALVVLGPDGAATGTVKPMGTASGGVRRYQVSGLEPLTTYHYGFLRQGEPTPGGRFTTFQNAGVPTNFTVAMGSCSDRSDNPVFRAIANQAPLFFMQNGDLHYDSLHTNDPEDFRAAYERELQDPAQSQLYRACALTYMWDDHDFGPNNSGHDNPSHAAAHAVYRERVPHYPFRLQPESRTRAAPIMQAFSVGRVRFILSDLRSEHSREPQSLMGTRQREAFFDELRSAKEAHRLVVWMSSVPWISKDCKDAWGCADRERRQIANFIKALGLPVCIISGDAHMVAIDDGLNSDYADGGGAPMPVFQCASLGQSGSYKGGPYNRGANAGGAQFGLMNVTDDGVTLTVNWSARDGSDGLGDKVVQSNVDAEGPIAYQFQVNASGALVR